MHYHGGQTMERQQKRMHQYRFSQRQRSARCSCLKWRCYSRKIVWYMCKSQMNSMTLGQGTAQDYGGMATSHGCLQMYGRVFSATNMTSLLLGTLVRGR